MIQSHLDCNFSKIYILLIKSNALNILAICKRTYPNKKTCIMVMLCHLIYIKNMKIHFITLYVQNSKFKLHCTYKFCCMYELQYMHCFFPGKDWLLLNTLLEVFVGESVKLTLFTYKDFDIFVSIIICCSSIQNHK